MNAGSLALDDEHRRQPQLCMVLVPTFAAGGGDGNAVALVLALLDDGGGVAPRADAKRKITAAGRDRGSDTRCQYGWRVG